MVNYQRTEECYKCENYAYPKPIEQKGYEMWLQKVTNPNTGTFYKLSDLPKMGSATPDNIVVRLGPSKFSWSLA
jgi:hypothetical protein